MDIKRAIDIEHKYPKGKDCESYAYSLSDKIFHTNQLFLYSEKVPPSRLASAPHIHRSIDEIIHVTSGQLYAFEGSDGVLLKQGDSICFHANSEKKHYLENKSDEEAEFLIFRRSTNVDDTFY